MSEFKPVVSSNIESAAFDTATGSITVRFKNKSQYRYPNAGPKIWKEFEKTFDGKDGRSAGKFLNAKLRPMPYERIEDWNEA